MANKTGPELPSIQTRQQLYSFLQAQMHTSYVDVLDEKRLRSRGNLIKSYILELDLPAAMKGGPDPKQLKIFIEETFGLPYDKRMLFFVTEKEEEGFYELSLRHQNQNLTLYLDTSTNPRFWYGFSISQADALDQWLRSVVKSRTRIDFVWLWPLFLELIQRRGMARGFGLDYDYRRFEDDSEVTTYLKMQLWGGEETQRIYHMLKNDKDFRDKVVLSKIRMKEFEDDESRERFALQDVRYEGKFTTRGTDFGTHVGTLSYVRSEYEKVIRTIEDNYALRWRETELGSALLEGYALHFLPNHSQLPVKHFCNQILNGTEPFRLLGFVQHINDHLATAEVVDLHTGGELSVEVRPDSLTVYLPQNTCGNTIARLYTNLQHSYNALFSVEADNGDVLFQPSDG